MLTQDLSVVLVFVLTQNFPYICVYLHNSLTVNNSAAQHSWDNLFSQNNMISEPGPPSLQDRLSGDSFLIQ